MTCPTAVLCKTTKEPRLSLQNTFSRWKNLQEALRDPGRAPRPLSISDYRKRKGVPAENITIAAKRIRGGVLADLRREAKNFHRLASLAATKQEVDKFNLKAKQCSKQAKQLQKDRKKANCKTKKVLDVRVYKALIFLLGLQIYTYITI